MFFSDDEVPVLPDWENQILQLEKIRDDVRTPRPESP
jgi:general secretion pathway protein D